MSNHDNETISTPSGVKQNKSRFWANIGIFISGIAAICLIVTMIFASYALLIENSRFARAFTELTHRFNQVENGVMLFEKNAVTTEKSLQAMRELLNLQAAQIVALQKSGQTNRDDFFISEAYSRVKMASDNLQYENNAETAIRWLQAADDMLARLASTRVYAARAALASDIAALKAVPSIDVTGIYVRLAALNAVMDKLPLTIPLFNPPAKVLADQNPLPEPWWRRGWNSIKEALQRIVVVRKNVPDAVPFIAPEQQVFFYQNLHFEMEKAEWGLLHRQPDIYRSGLQQVMNWIKQYANPESLQAKEMLKELQALQGMNIRPAVPLPTASLQALQNAMNGSGR